MYACMYICTYSYNITYVAMFVCICMHVLYVSVYNYAKRLLQIFFGSRLHCTNRTLVSEQPKANNTINAIIYHAMYTGKQTKLLHNKL